MKIALTLHVRMKSKRLPLKPLRLINNKSLFENILERMKLSSEADDIIVCTSTNPQDDIIIEYADKMEVATFRGDEIDVITRLHDCVKMNNIDFIISHTGDNPFFDPKYSDLAIQQYKQNPEIDFLFSEDLPVGVNIRGISRRALEYICRTKQIEDTEYYLYFFLNNENIRKQILRIQDSCLQKPTLRLTVDTPEDLLFTQELLKKTKNRNINDTPLFELIKIIDENPELTSINNEIVQRLPPKNYVEQGVYKE